VRRKKYFITATPRGRSQNRLRATRLYFYDIQRWNSVVLDRDLHLLARGLLEPCGFRWSER